LIVLDCERVTWWSREGWWHGKGPALDGLLPCELDLLLLVGSSDEDEPRLEVRWAAWGLYVEVWGYGNTLAAFYVHESDQAAFTVERLPALIQAFGPIQPREAS
jgi:hypothetical protein